MEYETIIGLEVHAQLNTKSKMFCRCSTAYASGPANSYVCPVCLALPGVLPTINKLAVEYTVMTALALHSTVSGRTKFDRKNYAYPDLMKGYQISQYDAPIGSGGWLDINADGGEKRVGITRVHLEEDVAKLLHRVSADGGSYSLVDVNRSGVPLMEIVGEPDLRSPEEARQYLIKLRAILRYLGVSTANMEEGSFRVDANISISPGGLEKALAKIEVKNLNSFRSVYRAMEYEADRQRKAVARGEKLTQETRGWLEDKGKTVSQRSKEYAHDYRYFPEPDLPPLELDKKWLAQIEAALPELPEARRDRFMKQYALPQYDADLLTAAKELADYFEEAAGGDIPAKEVSNWLLGAASGIMNARGASVATFSQKVSPERLAGLIVLNLEGGVSTATAKAVLQEMFDGGKEAVAIVAEQGLGRMDDGGQIEAAAAAAIEANPQAVADYRAGKERAVKFLVGQVMRATRGRADPNLAADLIKKKLEEG